MDRRTFLRTGLAAGVGLATFGRSFLRRSEASHPLLVPGDGPYGALGDPDALGFRLPPGFGSRLIARSGTPVEGTAYVWHVLPDGGATFATSDPDGGWIYVSNSEAPVGGGVGAIRFDADGGILDAYPILEGSSTNCAGGPTPWNTWLSCEETIAGRVWECDPTGGSVPRMHLAMGLFQHEAAAVDPLLGQVYMTEDTGDGGFYRFDPQVPGDLSAGTLRIAGRSAEGIVEWHAVPNPTPIPFVQPATRHQVAGATPFNGGEGIWFDAPTRTVYFVTKNDHKVWEYDVDAGTLRVLHDRVSVAGSPLSGPDNIVVTASGDLFVCEDGGNMEIVLITPEGAIAPFLQLTGQTASELAGVAFSPAGDRMYLSSQRADRIGATYEITGPFRDSL